MENQISGRMQRVDGRDAATARVWLAGKGFRVVVNHREMSDEFNRLGLGDALTRYHRFWADLVPIRNPSAVVPNYGSGESEDAAIVRAVERFRTEQG